jgi:hypothetical protein
MYQFLSPTIRKTLPWNILQRNAPSPAFEGEECSNFSSLGCTSFHHLQFCSQYRPLFLLNFLYFFAGLSLRVRVSSTSPTPSSPQICLLTSNTMPSPLPLSTHIHNCCPQHHLSDPSKCSQTTMPVSLLASQTASNKPFQSFSRSAVFSVAFVCPLP